MILQPLTWIPFVEQAWILSNCQQFLKNYHHKRNRASRCCLAVQVKMSKRCCLFQLLHNSQVDAYEKWPPHTHPSEPPFPELIHQPLWHPQALGRVGSCCWICHVFLPGHCVPCNSEWMHLCLWPGGRGGAPAQSHWAEVNIYAQCLFVIGGGGSGWGGLWLVKGALCSPLTLRKYMWHWQKVSLTPTHDSVPRWVPFCSSRRECTASAT